MTLVILKLLEFRIYDFFDFIEKIPAELCIQKTTMYILDQADENVQDQEIVKEAAAEKLNVSDQLQKKEEKRKNLTRKRKLKPLSKVS
jgi:hypothetical protein